MENVVCSFCVEVEIVVGFSLLCFYFVFDIVIVGVVGCGCYCLGFKIVLVLFKDFVGGFGCFFVMVVFIYFIIDF